ncbi:MAG: DUF2069 domain-containing protein [Rhodanobacteraceae bacterium]|nr:DUF2069 domain-containing protein [Rhodanobacteraceae bacterium]
MNGTRVCALALLALLLLRLVWHAVVHAPVTGMASGVATLLLPLLPFVAAWAFKLRGMWIYAGIGVWVYLCHGGMEAVANPAERAWALAEVALAALYFAGLWLRTREARVQPL